MTQMAAKPEAVVQAATSVAAAVHYQGDRWRLVILSHRNGLVLEQAVSLDAAEQIGPVLEQYKVERLVRIAPSRETVARCAPVPPGANGELVPVLALMAEAQMPETIAAHRRAAGTVAEAQGGSRSALLVGWKGEAPGEVTGEMVEEFWTTPAAALSVLRQGRGQSAVYADPDEGAMSILAFGNKALARVLVEDAPNATAFARSVAAVVGETCAAAGVTTPMTQLGQSGVVLSLDAGVIPAARAAVSGIPDQRSWFEQYGLALGAAMMALSSDPLVRGLAGLRAAAPVKEVNLVERGANWLAVRKHAWWLLAASVALLLLGPWLIASARLAVLEGKAVGLGDKNRDRTESARRTALYRQLDSSRWPMAKLLADVSAAIPQGVTTESIRLASDQGLAIQGSAENSDQVNSMQANLIATRLLSNVKVNRQESGGSGVEFDLTADVVNPHTKAAGVEDWATKTLAVRLYGEGALNTTLPKNTGTARESTPARDPRAGLRGGGGGGGGGGERTERADRTERTERGGNERGNGGGGDRGSRSSEAPSRPAATPPGEAPAPLTDEQIGKMDSSVAMKEWVNRRTFPQKNPTLDATTKARLEDEVRKLREQMDKLKAQK